jgi:hypothetical protein
MSKPTLDYFTPVRAARSRMGVRPLLLGLAACALVGVTYVLEPRWAVLTLPLAVVMAIGGTCAALDDEPLERRMPLARLLALAACNLAAVAAVVSMILVPLF